MGSLKPFLSLYRRHPYRLGLGILLASITLLASILLLSLSAWFLAAAALAGLSGTTPIFNYLLPAAGVRFLALLRTAGRYFERVVSHDATFRLLTTLRIYTFGKLLPLSPGEVARFRQGELLNRLVADVDTLDHLYLRLLSPLFSALVVITTMTALLGCFDPRLALTLGIVLLLLWLLLPWLFYWLGKPVGAHLTQLRGHYRFLLVEWLQGQAELLIFGAAYRFRQQLDQVESNWQQHQRQQARLTGLSQGFMVFCTGSTLVLMLWLCAAITIKYDGTKAWIALVAFLSLALFEALSPLAASFQTLGQVVSSAQRVQQLLTTTPNCLFPKQGPVPVQTQVALAFNTVSFTYPGCHQMALKEITFSLTAGEKMALIGHTGCGKSTLLHLLSRAWDLTCGTLQLAEHPIADYTQVDLRRMMTVVSQRVHLFSATLADNLRLADPTADQERLMRVVQQVGLTHLLEQQGLDLWLGEGGRQLSGGEQRRIGIARALLRQAPLLLLDEPTEGLDPESEQQIFNQLFTHAHNKSMILVTHRHYGLARMDRIAVLEAGRLVEYGTPAELTAQQGRYVQLQQRLY